MMKKFQFCIIILSLWIAIFGIIPSIEAQTECTAIYGTGSNILTLATGSPGELGLVEALANTFSASNDVKLCWKMAGSGQALTMLKDKQVDMVMVHAPAAEKAAVQEGWAINRTLIGSNEFYIVGPIDDPAGVANAKTAAEAYTLIAKAQATFLSRGDNSGTHKKELAIWKMAEIEPSGAWYIVTKEFMMATLKRANDLKGYFMTDSSTWIQSKSSLPNLTILFRGDSVLINTYHALCQADGALPAQQYALKFIEFLGSEEGQSIIRMFGKEQYGDSLYNDAEYAKQYVN